MFKTFIDKLFNKKKEQSLQRGTVKFFNITKGFGFIKIDDSGEEIFVHKSNVLGRIREKDHVQFEVEDGEKGPTAVKVQKI
ncbi:MAG TPA: cold shock domain-containing protein [Brumimicrobium sp.]|nr:cold shock domain-containing protein [Brumimicrobium sp.]